MKYIISIFVFILVSCQGQDSEQDAKKLAYYDSLTTTLKNRVDSVPTIQLSPEEELNYEPEEQTITLTLPKVNHAYPRVIDLHVELRGDSIAFYKLSAGKSFPQTEAATVKPKDTKTKIAQRLGVKPAQIKNKEPLKVGEPIIIGYD